MFETSMYEPKSLELVTDFASLFNVSTDYLMGVTNIREPINGLNTSYLDEESKKNVYSIYETMQKQKELDKKRNNVLTEKIYYMCPVYGQISAGQPNWAEENIEGRIPIDTNLMDIVNPEEHFFLRVNGESMKKVVKNGAFALIHKQDTVDNGEIAVVLVNGFDVTIKKFTRQGDLIILEPQSTDASFETQVYDKNTSIKILGKYVGKK